MKNVNKTNTTDTVVDAAANDQAKLDMSGVDLNPQEDSWMNAANVAAIAAAGTAALTMIGRGEVNIGNTLGAVAGVGVSYLGTKWFTEEMRVQDKNIGRFFGLMAGISFGNAFTLIGDSTLQQRDNAADYL